MKKILQPNLILNKQLRQFVFKRIIEKLTCQSGFEQFTYVVRVYTSYQIWIRTYDSLFSNKCMKNWFVKAALYSLHIWYVYIRHIKSIIPIIRSYTLSASRNIWPIGTQETSVNYTFDVQWIYILGLPSNVFYQLVLYREC